MHRAGETGLFFATCRAVACRLELCTADVSGRGGVQRPSAGVARAQAEDITVEAMQEHVARAVGLPARRQFLVVAEERARSASLGHLAKRMQVRHVNPKPRAGTAFPGCGSVFCTACRKRGLTCVHGMSASQLL